MTKKKENPYLVTFSKPYDFEGETFHSLDLSPVEDLTTEQIMQAERIFEKSGGVSALKELNLEYAIIVASMATGKPVEFFKGLPGKDGSKVKSRVSAYFFGSE